MRILYLSDIRFPLERANGIQTIETCHALSERGHEVTLLVRPDTSVPARDPFGFYGVAPNGRVRIERVPVRGYPIARRAAYVAAAAKRARRPDVDLVFTRDLGIASLLLRLPKAWRRPLVFESHGLAPVVGASLDALLTSGRAASTQKQRRLWNRERMVWANADGYVTITSALAQELEAHFGPRQAVVVVPDGVRLPPDRTFIAPSATASPRLVYAGHLYPWKGVETMLQALALQPAATAVIVGGHPQESDLGRLRRLAMALGISARVTFTGLLPHAEVAAWLSQADTLVLPNTATPLSARYSSPLKLFEYLGAGRPIVASDLPSFREILRHEINALLVPPEDASALAGAVMRLGADPSLAGRLARTAFDDAVLYTWEARAGRLESLLNEVMDAARSNAAG